MADLAETSDCLALEVIACPYHDGLLDVGMGLGATLLAEDQRLRAELRAVGLRVSSERIPPVDESRPEVCRVIELDRRLGYRVRAARRRGAFPLIFAGNCNSCLGTVAGVASDGLGVVWFDAHADFDTPEDNLSGFFDVMGLSILTGTGMRETTLTGITFIEIENLRTTFDSLKVGETLTSGCLSRWG